MSRCDPQPVEAAQLAEPCPRCGMPAGAWCLTAPRARWTTYLHAARFYAATATGRLPLRWVRS